ncbi:MAG: preprotein translocase subunit SecG [Candidatus Azambacteria bacterium]|nr:preprotein translocase subunit SecG [Candidatus Azambacteria bacterium]
MVWFNIIMIVISVVFTIMVLLQQRGAGLSGTFGGDGSGSYHTKRGMEKTIFFATIVLSVLFIGGAFIRLLL